jgi:uncharacterized membrane protein YoaK (UPF0700 family)
MHADDAGATAGSEARDPLFVLLALGAGVVDAISLTTLGVFTAAVTANMVLVGIALGDSDLHTALRAALAFAGFAAGVLFGERVLGGKARPQSRPSRLPAVLGAVAALQIAFLAIWLTADGSPEGLELDVLAIASGLAMGGQTAATRGWSTNLFTTYVSGTLTVLLSELATATGSSADRRRRVFVIVAVVAGATVGAVMLNHAREGAPGIPPALTLLVAAGAAAPLIRAPRPPAS